MQEFKYLSFLNIIHFNHWRSTSSSGHPRWVCFFVRTDLGERVWMGAVRMRVETADNSIVIWWTGVMLDYSIVFICVWTLILKATIQCKFLQICSDEERISSTSWMARGRVHSHFWVNYSFKIKVRTLNQTVSHESFSHIFWSWMHVNLF